MMLNNKKEHEPFHFWSTDPKTPGVSGDINVLLLNWS